MVYIPRTNTNGMSENPFYTYRTAYNPFPFSVGNCTWYAWGRTRELQPNVYPTLSLGNATTWWENSTGYEKGQEPRLGAVAVWGTRGVEHPGHVAVVEEIRENGDFVASNSNWGGPYFFMTTHTKASGYNNFDPNLYFKGFVYSYPSTPPVSPPNVDELVVSVNGNRVSAEGTASSSDEELTLFNFNVFNENGTLVFSSANLLPTPLYAFTGGITHTINEKGNYIMELFVSNVSGLVNSKRVDFEIKEVSKKSDYIPIWVLERKK